jgi:DNA repair protein RadC
LTAESILKRKYSPESKIPDPVDYLTHYKNSCCKVCLIKEENPLPPIQITRAADAYRLIKHELAPADRETLLSIMLDTKLYLLGIHTLAVGSLNTCGSTLREVFKSAILANASCIILAHNHPSGDLSPSTNDITFTQNAVSCGNLLDIKLHDHLIVSHQGYQSIRDACRRGKKNFENMILKSMTI